MSVDLDDILAGDAGWRRESKTYRCVEMVMKCGVLKRDERSFSRGRKRRFLEQAEQGGVGFGSAYAKDCEG